MRAKTKLTRLCSILLTLVLLVGLLPNVALAEGPATGTADFTTDPTAALALLNAAKTGTTNSTWVDDGNGNKTLTLNGVNFTTSAATAVKLPANTTIVLKGENTIKGGNTGSVDCYGIYGNGGLLTIQGTGTLDVTSGTSTGNQSFGIHARYDVTIKSGAVTATGGAAPVNQSFGISANRNLTITGGTVTATGSDANISSNGLWAGNGSVTISGGKVVAQGGNVSGTSSGIFANKVVIQNTDNRIPHVTTCGGTGENSRGIYVYGSSVSIFGGAVIAKAGSATSASALSKAPAKLPDAYRWRTSNSGDYTASNAGKYEWNGYHSYVEILDTTSAYTVSFDANSGSGTMATDPGVYGSYTLPENGFTPPAGKQFKGWAESKNGDVISGPIAVDGDKTLYAIWEDVTFTSMADFTSGGGTAALALLNDAKTGDTDSTWDGSILTLNGVNFVTTAATAVKLPAGATIVLADGTTNTIKSDNSSADECYGIYGVGGLTIQGGTKGTGTLNVTGGSPSASRRSFGIYSYGDVTISGGTVEAVAGNAVTTDSYGICSYNGRVNISVTDGGAAHVIAKGGDVTNPGQYSRSCGIFGYNGVTISGGTVEATGGNSSPSYGIFCMVNDITISGGTVKAEADDESGTASALNKQPMLPITGYSWRTSDSGDYYDPDYNWDENHTYLEIKSNPTITFNANGENASVDPTSGTTNAAGKLTSLPEPTRDGYTFKEWNTKQDGTGTTVTTSTIFNANTTVYAQWTAATYTVSFDANGGTDTMADVTGVSGNYTLPENGFTAPAGMQFKGWAKSTDGTVISDTTINVTADTTLYAIWEDIKYNVTVTGGTASATNAAKGTAVTLTANAAPSGQVFGKWVVVSGSITLADENSATTTFTMPAGNVSVKATYKAAPVTLSSIAITTPPTKTTYTAGESFNTAGMVVKATYSDSSTATVTGYTVSPSAALTTGNTSVTITYTEGGVTKTATQAITVNASTPTVPTTPTYTPPTYKVESTVSKDADGSVSFSKASAKKGDTVTITVTPDRYYKTSGVIVKDALGNQIAVTDNGNGTFTFQMPDSKVTVEPVFSWDNPFVDVAGDAYYAPAVEWALKNEVTDGTSDTTFSPDAGCTRGQIVTFLWRAAGCPEPAGMSSFTDVSADAYYAKAVAWAAEQGITGGTGDGKFSPDAVCTRSQSMTFLYRTAGSPDVSDLASFRDVEPSAYYAAAVAWAEQNGVTGGIGGGLFGSANDCTRAQIVAFLYRYFVK